MKKYVLFDKISIFSKFYCHLHSYDLLIQILGLKKGKKGKKLLLLTFIARADTARFLIEQGAPCGLYDSSGTTCLSLMIEKMPHVAMEAMEQFHIIDRAFRKHFFYLSYLEPDPKFLPEELPEEKSQLRNFQKRKREEKKERKETGQKNLKKLKSYAKTPLEVSLKKSMHRFCINL